MGNDKDMTLELVELPTTVGGKWETVLNAITTVNGKRAVQDESGTYVLSAPQAVSVIEPPVTPPPVSIPITVTPNAGALALTGFAPTIGLPRTVRPGLGGLVLTGFAPTVSTTAAVVAWNEPIGMATIDTRPFTTLAENASPHVPAWDTVGGVSILSDATAPQSPPNVMRVTYPAGFGSGSAPGSAGTDWSAQNLGIRVLYIRYASRISANWQIEDSGFTKQMYAWCNGSPDFFMACHGTPGTSGAITPYSMLQAIQVFPLEGGNPQGNWAPNLVPSTQIVRGQWHTIEYVLTGNTAGTVNGALDMYVDGIHCTSVTGIQWTTPQTNWMLFQFEPVWGGTGPTPVAVEQYLDYDYVYLSGKS